MEGFAEHSYVWNEDLPTGCPPVDAYIPQNEEFYRLVEEIPPTEKDFYSYRKLNPTKKLPRQVSECQARACSVFITTKSCSEVMKLPKHTSKKIAKLILEPSAGVVRNTGQGDHFAWWVAKGFNPTTVCCEIELQES